MYIPVVVYLFQSQKIYLSHLTHFYPIVQWHSPLPLASWILHSLPAVAATNSRDEPSTIVACIVWNMNWQHTAHAPAFPVEREWLTDTVSEWVSEWARVPASPPVCSCCPDSALHLSQSLNSSSCSCCQSVVFPRLMVRYSWWKQSLGKAL